MELRERWNTIKLDLDQARNLLLGDAAAKMDLQTAVQRYEVLARSS